ncbi:DUF2478 domain-containing protein [Bradyrhizobium sp. DASA03007]|uniref:DUF2478 domain-containing protein n=1 Tax=unclassified Bradyrhizobium TaxID=2631580 RepID=UPI003F71EDDE
MRIAWGQFSTVQNTDVDRLLADFAEDIAQQGVRIGGIVQRHPINSHAGHARNRRCDGTRDLDFPATRQRSYVLLISIQMGLPRPQLSFPGHFAPSISS